MKTRGVIYFTSFTFAYLDRALVLADTLKKFNPNSFLVAIVCDILPETCNLLLDKLGFDALIYAADLDIPSFEQWIFMHDIVEASTAIKGIFLDWVFTRGLHGKKVDKAIYLDPDIAVFSSLGFIEELLDETSIVLTPHLLQPSDTVQGILDNEISAMAHGTFNLGFLAVRNDPEGKRFARWWGNRLRLFCYDDIARGLFTDQKWCDLVPCFFDKVKILRDLGANVASWNLSERNINISVDGRILVNDYTLRFFHFTKLGVIGDVMTMRYMGDNFSVLELWRWYKEQVARHSLDGLPKGYWFYGRYDNQAAIERQHRVLYRTRSDVQSAYPNPFAVEPGDSYYRWVQDEVLSGPDS